MRIPALAILTIGAVLTATPTMAQTYDPKYPVCLQIYQSWRDYYFECAYTSLAQCNMSASGRAAQCIVNPYYAGAKKRSRDNATGGLAASIERMDGSLVMRGAKRRSNPASLLYHKSWIAACSQDGRGVSASV